MNPDQQNMQVSRTPLTAPTTAAHSPERADAAWRPTNITLHQLDVALTWLRRGHPVIPCSRTTKRPLLEGFSKDARAADLAPFSDAAQVERWWRGQHVRAHVGLLTRRLVAIDLDVPKAKDKVQGVYGEAVFRELVKQAGADWPQTFTVRTPSGGLHLYFEQPEQPIGCATGEGRTAPHLGRKIDVRGVGGFVIACGSYSSAQSRPYTQISPDGLRPQPLPDWLHQLLTRPAPEAPPRPTPVLRSRARNSAATQANDDRYAQVVLDKLAVEVAEAGAGMNWSRLTRAAIRLAELAPKAPSVLTEQVVTQTLLAASKMEDSAEAARAIRTAWEGRTSGRIVPRPRHVGGAA